MINKIDVIKWLSDNHRFLHIQNKLMYLHEPVRFEGEDKDEWFVYYDNDYKCFNWTRWYCLEHILTYFTEDKAKEACRILNEEKFMMKG